MAKVTPPPLYNAIAEEEDGIATVPWSLFFNNLYVGDTGTEWTPVFSGLTESGGSADITGTYYKISQSLTYFSIVIDPATSTSSVAGVTYCGNLPLNITKDGACSAVGGVLGLLPGMVQSSSNRIYPPDWTSVTVPVTICGIIEAR